MYWGVGEGGGDAVDGGVVAYVCLVEGDFRQGCDVVGERVDVYCYEEVGSWLCEVVAEEGEAEAGRGACYEDRFWHSDLFDLRYLKLLMAGVIDVRVERWICVDPNVEV